MQIHEITINESFWKKYADTGSLSGMANSWLDNKAKQYYDAKFPKEPEAPAPVQAQANPTNTSAPIKTTSPATTKKTKVKPMTTAQRSAGQMSQQVAQSKTGQGLQQMFGQPKGGVQK